MEEAPTDEKDCAEARELSKTGSRRRRRPSRREQKQLKKQRRDQLNKAAPFLASTAAPPHQIPISTGSPSSAQVLAGPSVDPESESSINNSSVALNQVESSSIDDDDDDSVPYVPTPIPSLLRDADGQDAADKTSAASKKLGKWFPKASVVKSPVWCSNADANKTSARAALVLFYQYVEPPWPPQRVRQLTMFLERIATTSRVLGGRIRVAPEGVNATISSIDVLSSSSSDDDDDRPAAATKALTALRHFARDLRNFDDAFCSTDFKFLSNLSPDRHFAQLKLFPVQELVFYGLRSEQAPLSKTGVHLSPQDFHHKLSQPDTVVIDVRNHYEAAIGRFDGQEMPIAASQSGETSEDEAACTAGGGATYIDPKMRKSTDFPAWLESSKDLLKDKTCLFYCTGGVRCERASAHANQVLGNRVRGVFQLQGGVEAYLQAYPDGGYWRGKNFVFDKREAVGADNRDGDGGVLRRGNKEGGTLLSTTVETRCCLCGRPWDRYVGKKKCGTCGVPVLVCETCLADKSTKANPAAMRCPLCVEQGVTVPASDVEWTSNGTKVVLSSSPSDRDNPASHAAAITAPSVLKWGGGHAARKKTKRRFRHQSCRFGASCTRSDCFFAHPSTSRSELDE